MSETKPNADTAPADPNRLKTHFAGKETSTRRWDDLWKDGTYLPWDRGTPNPALPDALVDRRNLLGAAVDGQGRRKRALVPGCGKGYDVLLLASFGYDAWGLESSSAAVEQARRFQSEHEHEYKAVDISVDKGKATFVYGDFFDDGWVRGVSTDGSSTFDFIYDYTFLCALPPTIRPRWASRMAQLLDQTSGNLLCLEFPTYKEPSAGGPPWALYPAVYLQLLTQPGREPGYKEDGYIVEDELELGEGGLVRKAHWQPKRTHKIGEGTDWMSIWRHQSFEE